MSTRKTLGGDRLGSGNKMKVELHGFERSNHDLGYLWRSTMSPGTLVPFLKKLALPGDTFDITLNAHCNTHPTIGPLFGSYKLQLDVFAVPLRLYQSGMHNNALNVGLKMSDMKLPMFKWNLRQGAEITDTDQIDALGSHPSSLFHYLGYKGAGINPEGDYVDRAFQAVPLLAYYDIYKQYYANKAEPDGYVIANDLDAQGTFPNFNTIKSEIVNADGTITSKDIPDQASYPGSTSIRARGSIVVNADTAGINLNDIIINIGGNGESFDLSLLELSGGDFRSKFDVPTGKYIYSITIETKWLNYWVNWWAYPTSSTIVSRKPVLHKFPLTNIDDMREKILATNWRTQFELSSGANNMKPYKYSWQGSFPGNNVVWYGCQFPQQGLAIKTYQSDLFNNWVNTEVIDGVGGINEISKVSTAGGSFSIDALNLAKKVYDMLNRVAVSGGSYNDWLEAVYDHDVWNRAEMPVYLGGLSKEIVFQEVVSNSQNEDTVLGQLAGKGVLGSKHKGGKVVAKVSEPSYIMGIVSITPRIDYSQGNDWDINLQTMDDLHKPNLDQIGFQDLLTERMAWWSTYEDNGEFLCDSAGKQPAWIEYMTSVNEVHGNFAVKDNQQYMVLNRNYEVELFGNVPYIKDLTTYIDPVKFNTVFAQRALDAQNFWIQLSVDIEARRKMSAKVMPNL